jgi:hypothetical protein
MRSFATILYSNNAIFSFRKMKGWLLFLLFLINTMMLSAPLIRARADITGAQVLSRFDGLTPALLAAFAQTDCSFDVALQCDQPTVITTGTYEIGFLIPVAGDRYVFFDENQVVIQTPDELFLGRYEFAAGPLSAIATERDLEQLVYGFATAGAGFDFTLIVLGQLIQTTLYVASISAMLLISNYRATKRKISFSEALRLTVLAMLGPALIGGLIGFVEPSVAGIVFITIYSLRMMYLYFGLFSKTNLSTL